MTSTRIRAIRKRARMTRARFAKLIGVCIMSLAKWEWGTYKPRRSAQKLLLLIEAHPETLTQLGNLRGRR